MIYGIFNVILSFHLFQNKAINLETFKTKQ